jgi:Tfp pilus assembly protein PilF
MKIFKFTPLVMAGVVVALALGLGACGKKKKSPPPPAATSTGLPVAPKLVAPVSPSTNVPPKLQAGPKPVTVATNAVAATTTVARAVMPAVNPTNPPSLIAPVVGASLTNVETQTTNDMAVAFMALEQGKPSVAQGVFAKILQKDPTNQRARFGLSTALIQSKKYREAQVILEAMIKEVPQDYRIKNNLAWIYATATDMQVRDGKRAVALAQEALMLNPTDCHVWSTLSEAYFICGRYDKALRNAEHALRVGHDTQAEAQLLEQYQMQVERCRKAAESMAILE